MGISHHIETNGDLLLVTARGVDDDLADVQAYGMAVLEAAVRHASTRVLCDERELKYSIDAVDLHEYGRFIAERAPRVVRAAIVCAADDLEDAAYFETVVVNRGLCVRVFTDVDAARAWLGVE